MVDFLKDLPQKFRERYLNTHENYLKSIADIAVTISLKNFTDRKISSEYMVKRLNSAGIFTESKIDDDYESVYFRNLRNAWYHEVTLNNPEDDLDQRIKFAPWKIVQCYYCVVAGISALIRCFYSKVFNSHDKVFNLFGSLFLNNKKRRVYFLPPYNFMLNPNGILEPDYKEVVDWDNDMLHFNNIMLCLKSVKKKKGFTTIPHYLKSLREWVQYEDAYLFFRLYGNGVKRDLDFYLNVISFGYLLQTEFFFIKLFGWDTVKLQFDTFYKEMRENLKITPRSLNIRFNVYKKNLLL